MTKDNAFRVALETADGILNSDWRNWQELSSPEEFERWVKARANHMAIALRQALAEPDTQNERDEAVEAVRRAFCKLPRYSFFIGDGSKVLRVADNCGKWIDRDQAHELFDPIVVDSLVSKERSFAAIEKAKGKR